MNAQWKTWHKVTAAVVGGLLVLVLGCGLLGSTLGSTRPSPTPTLPPPSAPRRTTAAPPTSQPAEPTTEAPPPSQRPSEIAAENVEQPPVETYYTNCAAARAAGAAPLHRGDPGYSRKLDRDGDGTACE